MQSKQNAIRVPASSDKHYSRSCFRAVNAGKSLRNEDQARIHVGYLERKSAENGHKSKEFHTPPSSPGNDETSKKYRHRIPYVYFALFDGHAGPGISYNIRPF